MVRFELPAGWSVEAPWEREGPGPFVARLDDLMRLLVEEYGGTGQALSFDDLAAIVGDFAGDGARD